MNNQLLDLLTRLDNRSGQDAAYIETKNFFESLGFNYVNIVLASYKDGPLGMFTNMGAEWLSHYVDQGYHECDLIIDLVADQDVMRLCDPVSNLALPTRDRPKTDKMLAEVQEEGLISSLVISRHSTVTDRYVGFNLGLDHHRPEAERLLASNQDAIQLGAALTQLALIEDVEGDACGSHWLPMAKERMVLSDREAEVLKWLSEGFRNDRISDQLGISNATVNFHVTSAKRKLGAKTREQAVAIALMQRLI